jgi:transposase
VVLQFKHECLDPRAVLRWSGDVLATGYKQRNVVERCFSHLKDWRRVATRYDKLVQNFAASVTLVAILIWWT